MIYRVKDKLFNKFVINSLLANTALQTERQKMKILKSNNWFFHAVFQWTKILMRRNQYASVSHLDSVRRDYNN